MRIVWRRKNCAARDVYEETGRANGWAPSTTKTLLRRLVDKGHLTVTPVGTSYLYRPPRPAWQSIAGAADTLLENTLELEGMRGKLLAYMVKKSRLSPDDLAQLRALIDQHVSDPEAESGSGPGAEPGGKQGS
jgi:predicted transcriptional regulator